MTKKKYFEQGNGISFMQLLLLVWIFGISEFVSIGRNSLSFGARVSC